jgi:hypothetical protein
MSEYLIADFDNVRRLRVLAASTPGATIAETVLHVPFNEVWTVAADLEGELSNWVADVKRVQVAGRNGERLTAKITGRSGLRAPFNIVLRTGWCVMQSRFVLGAMAATPEGDGTRFAFAGAFRNLGPLGRVLQRLAGPLTAGTLDRFAARVAARHPKRHH